MAIFGLLLALIGCKEPEQQGASLVVERKKYPQSAFVADIRFRDLPAPLSGLEAKAHYRVENEGCVKPLPFSGAILPPEYDIPLTVKAINEDHYEAEFHEDALVDADYFNRGLCRWAFQHISVRFKSPTTAFIASYSGSNQADHSAEQRYHYLVSDYFKKPAISELVFGERPDFYKPELGPQFQIILSAREAGPG